MSEAFDPYHKWLAIPPEEQPPNHYRLLSMKVFESDPDVIASAADKQMAHIRSFQAGQHSALSQKILNEIAAARVCLLNPEKKAAYDAALRRRTVPKAAPLEAPATSGFDLEGLALSANVHRPTPSRRKKNAPWLPLAIAGAVVLVLVIIGVVSLTGGDKEKKVASGGTSSAKPSPEATVPAEKPKPEATSPVERPKEKPVAPKPSTTKAEPTEPDEKEPPSEPDKTEPEKPSAPAESPEKAEKRLTQALADAKTPEDYKAVAQDGLKVFEQAAAGGQSDLTKRIATMAVVAARKAKDGTLAFDAAYCYATGHKRAGGEEEGDEQESSTEDATASLETGRVRPQDKLVVEVMDFNDAVFNAKFPPANNRASDGRLEVSSTSIGSPQDVFTGRRAGDVWALGMGNGQKGSFIAAWNEPPRGRYIILFGRITPGGDKKGIDPWGNAVISVNGGRPVAIPGMSQTMVAIIDLGRLTAIKSVAVSMEGRGNAPGLSGIEIHETTGVENRPGMAKDGPLPKPDKSGWIVIFRSSDPATWNSDVNKGKDDFAVSLSKAPDDIKFLRMRAAGQKAEVIIPIEKAKLGVQSDNGRYGWNGMNHKVENGYHLGLYYCQFPARRAGDIAVEENRDRGSPGYGFGHLWYMNDRQGYTWNGVALPQTVFEIAVKATALTSKERKALLK